MATFSLLYMIKYSFFSYVMSLKFYNYKANCNGFT